MVTFLRFTDPDPESSVLSYVYNGRYIWKRVEDVETFKVRYQLRCENLDI